MKKRPPPPSTELPENTLVAGYEPGLPAPVEVYEELQVNPVAVPKTPDLNIHDVHRIILEHCGANATREQIRDALRKFLGSLTPAELEALNHKWHYWARPTQIAPRGDWTFWLLLAGRGFGKTRTGAEWINERVQSGLGKRIALVAPTAADVRKVMVEGESGLLAISPPWNRPLFEPSKLQLTWPNGAIAQLFSAEEPERLRGPQCDTFWADELAAWKKLQLTWDMLQFGFRLGSDPRGVVTTTPKPLQIVRDLLKDDREKGGQTAVTRGSTYDNKANLAPKFYQTVVAKYEGTRLGRQELDAEVLEDMPGALWQRSKIDANRVRGTMPFPEIIKPMSPVPGEEETQYEDREALQRAADAIVAAIPEDLTRVVVAVDPNASNDEGSDEIGITVSAKGISGRGYVLADCTCRGTPNEWGTVAVIAADVFKADRVIAEANNGGNMVQSTVESAAKFLKIEGKRTSDFIAVTLVHASRGKVTRAEPISALYEQDRVTHVGVLKTLEDQMCLFTTDFDRKAMGYSPDRVDSLVWGIHSLFFEDQDGSGIFEFYGQQVAEQMARQHRKDDSANLIKMFIDPAKGVNTAYGMSGKTYPVVDGFILAESDDVKGFRNSGFTVLEA